jgi:hypothetical protein
MTRVEPKETIGGTFGMNKIIAILVCFFIAIVIGFVASFFIGPMDFEETLPGSILGRFGISFQSESYDAEDSTLYGGDEDEMIFEPEFINESDSPLSFEPIVYEPDTRPSMADHPLVGRWEIETLVEIDPHNMDEIGALIEFNDDATGVEHHAEDPRSRPFTWDAESGRLTITPTDASFRIRTYDYELELNTLTIFFNRNRTSYFEAHRIP